MLIKLSISMQKLFYGAGFDEVEAPVIRTPVQSDEKITPHASAFHTTLQCAERVKDTSVCLIGGSLLSLSSYPRTVKDRGAFPDMNWPDVARS
jgi:hypothetical protein